MKHLFSHAGRAGRTEFVFWSLVFNIISGLLFALRIEMSKSIVASVPTSVQDLALLGLVSLVSGIIGLVVGWCSLTLYARRLHDLNVRGWWYLGFIAFLVMVMMVGLFSTVAIELVRILGVAFFLLVALKAGTSGENRFGPEPSETEGFFPRALAQKAVFFVCVALTLGVMVFQSVYTVKAVDMQMKQVQISQEVER